MIRAEGESESAKLISDATKQVRLPCNLQFVPACGISQCAYGRADVEAAVAPHRSCWCGAGPSAASLHPCCAVFPLRPLACHAASCSAAHAQLPATPAPPPQAGNGLIELRRIEAARDIAGTLSKSRNVVYLPSGGPNMLLGINPSQQ